MDACLPWCVWNATPRSLSPLERNTGLWTQAYMRSIGPEVTREQSPAFLRNSNGRLDFPGPTQEASCIPRRYSRILLHLEKNHVVPPSSQDVALCRYSIAQVSSLRVALWAFRPVPYSKQCSPSLPAQPLLVSC